VIHFAHLCLLRLLRLGGAAEVHEVLTPQRERRALELLEADLDPALAPKLVARLAQEGESLAMIEHVNVARFHDAGLDRGPNHD
jgi:hypothetical protein